VRGALGVPGDRDSAGVSVAFVGYATTLGFKLAANGVAALRLRYGDRERLVGDGEPAASLSGDRYELFRALAGRRSRDQILAMGWEGDPAAYVDLIPAYGPRVDALLEWASYRRETRRIHVRRPQAGLRMSEWVALDERDVHG
jgi:hypothetical protein